jgi:hypothetical protein
MKDLKPEKVILIDPDNHKDDNAVVNDILEESLNQLSLDDRDKTSREVNGELCMSPVETPELIEASLAKLDSSLDAIPFKKKVAYLQSQEFIHTYINDPDFRLRFLRAELFNEREAAVRLVKYCDYVLELFGSFALERHIKLSDFSKKEIKWMQMGYVQLMPYRDKSGRRVILQIIDANVLVEIFSRLKIYHYMMTTASNDIETQKKGVILIVWPGGAAKDWKIPREPSSRARHLSSQRHDVVPVRYAAYHYCMHDNPILRAVRSVAILYGGSGRMTKSRIRMHMGEDIELRYAMQGYGVPVDFIPVTGTGNIKLNHLKPWMKTRRLLEDLEHSKIVECPGSYDVVFKPGKRLMFHPGNLLFERLIMSKADEYSSASSKRNLYIWLQKEITETREGHFLKWDDDGYWTKLEDEAQITTKISTSCKAVNKKLKRAWGSDTQLESSTFAFGDNNTNRKRPIEECGFSCIRKFPCAGKPQPEMGD